MEIAAETDEDNCAKGRSQMQIFLLVIGAAVFYASTMILMKYWSSFPPVLMAIVDDLHFGAGNRVHDYLSRVIYHFGRSLQRERSDGQRFGYCRPDNGSSVKRQLYDFGSVTNAPSALRISKMISRKPDMPRHSLPS